MISEQSVTKKLDQYSINVSDQAYVRMESFEA